MKTFKIVLLITILLIILIYVTNITAIPNSIILFKMWNKILKIYKNVSHF